MSAGRALIALGAVQPALRPMLAAAGPVLADLVPVLSVLRPVRSELPLSPVSATAETFTAGRMFRLIKLFR